ncbi:cyclin-like protein [Patellaria atrata CBS 101060]|uniref:RNA polymerase II holoenzyme cyclin-like subunit n=1 Tax=Patellaria atrata CBS 101060 TaxID=1346257 RepID=A0A9P4VPC8_9PEZI|nr:cyclin-like protein [Patellaria atrata CBS 101060]
MAPTQTDQDLIGPHPSFIEVAKPYIFQQRIQDCLFAIGMTEAKDDNVRLQGVAWIDNVRKSMQLPVRTFNTAVVYYHKFRLVHSDNQYNWADAAAAALFTACKIEDTLKKSREILCASYNLKLSPAEHLTPDDPLFESHSKTIIGLERLMLESSGFDFRSRHPQELVIKLAKACSFTKDLEGKTAYKISLDLYRTFAPVKQTTSTMAIACVELAARLHEIDLARVLGEDGINYARFSTSRAEVMETLLDLLDLYTHHKPSTVVGPDYPLEYYISIRITLNQEASASSLPRYTSKLAPPLTQTNGTKGKNGTTTLASPPAPIIAPISATGTRGQSGTVRFMLDAARASAEKEAVKEYFTVEEEEYEVDVEVDPGKTRRPR